MGEGRDEGVGWGRGGDEGVGWGRGGEGGGGGGGWEGWRWGGGRGGRVGEGRGGEGGGGEEGVSVVHLLYCQQRCTIESYLFPSFLHHHCLQILYATNFLIENVFYLLVYIVRLPKIMRTFAREYL